MIVYDLKGMLTSAIPVAVDEYLTAQESAELNSGNLVLSDTKSMIFVESFENKDVSIAFMKKFVEESDLKTKFIGEKFDIFVISEDNFDLFYKTKDISSYLNFFDKHY